MEHVKHNLSQLLAKPIDRREFLKLVGLSALAIVGVTRVLQSLGIYHVDKQDHANGGWGRAGYGGVQTDKSA